MKNLIKLFLITLAMLIVSAPVLFAQDILVPETWMDVITSFNTWFSGLGGVAALTVFLAAFLNKILNVTGSGLKQLVAILVAVLLSVIAGLVKLGIYADLSIIHAVIYGLGSGLVANGIFDVSLVRKILAALKLHE